MKKIKITHWITTCIVAIMMVYSAYAQLTQPAMAQFFQLLGFPAYFRIELSIAKLIGAILLLAPIHSIIKEWAYAGFTIIFISAFIALCASGVPLSARLMPVIFLAVLAASYLSYHKLHKTS